MTTGKTIALTIQTFVGKVMSLLFNILCMFVIAFLPRNKRLLISWPQSLSTVILEPKKIKYVLCVTKSLRRKYMGKQCQTLFWGVQKSLQMIAAMELKDAYSLEGKL